ncbi:MAG TPA: Uma2 family endonuclease, partial [Armatimonadota bacterium]|nr:Uma2 family endonuclease [Armatimonadota bacterium]
MSPKTPQPAQPPGSAPARWKWTGDELIQLGELGVLPPGQKLELMDGEIIRHIPTDPLHAVLVGLIAELLAEHLSSHGFHVRQEKPVRLNSYYDPLPDVAVVKGRLLDYKDRFPGPDDVVLITEVADTSLDYDRSDKM